MTYKTEIDDVVLIVHYSIAKPSKGSTDGRHGPKLEPDDPGYIEIDTVEFLNGTNVAYSKDLWDQLLEEIGEDLYQRSIPDDMERYP